MALYDNLYKFLVGCPFGLVGEGLAWPHLRLLLRRQASLLNWTTEDCQRMLPYRSQRGDSRGAVEYVLIFNITTWDDAKLGCQASLLVRVDFRARPIVIVRNAWDV